MMKNLMTRLANKLFSKVQVSIVEAKFKPNQQVWYIEYSNKVSSFDSLEASNVASVSYTCEFMTGKLEFEYTLLFGERVTESNLYANKSEALVEVFKRWYGRNKRDISDDGVEAIKEVVGGVNQ
jgi:hypothetical protein